MPHDPGMTASVLGAGAALLALFAMAQVACIDIRRLEIDPAWAALAACSALGAIIAVEGGSALPGAVAAAAIAGGAAWIAVRLLPGRMGRIDVWLLATVGLATGPGLLLPVLGLALAFFLAAFSAYGLARGKRPGRTLRHMIPWAPPFMAAAGPFFAWRVASALRPDLAPEGAWAAAALALAGALIMAAALAAGALPIAVRRIHQRKEN